MIHGNAFEVLPGLKTASFDLLFADPPYNLTKTFGKEKFAKASDNEYEAWLDSWLSQCVPLLKQTASVYICGDWRSGSAIQRVGTKYFRLRNRITWEREKGRGAKANWKNASEDIWFFTVSDEFTFDLDAVKQRRRVMAPYRENGKPKDWDEAERRLEDVVSRFPASADAWFYLGATRLLDGDAAGAREALAQAHAIGVVDRADETTWLLATAEARVGAVDEARPKLRSVCDGSGEFKSAACSALDSLR